MNEVDAVMLEMANDFWGRTFYFQLPLIAIGFFNALLILKCPTKDQETDWKHMIEKIDFGGALALLAAISTLLVGLDRGSNVSWHSFSTLTCLCASLCLFVAFLLVEWKFAAHPFLPSRILADRSLLACSICNFLSHGGWLGIIYDLPLYWQAGEGLSATQSAIRLLPGSVAGAVGSLTAGWIMKKTGRCYWLTTVSYIIYAAGMVPILISTGWVWESIWGIWAGTVLAGFFGNVAATTTMVATSRLALLSNRLTELTVTIEKSLTPVAKIKPSLQPASIFSAPSVRLWGSLCLLLSPSRL